MTSRRRLELSPTADEDLRDALQHTLQAWSPEQRDVYAPALNDAFERLTRYPNLGQPRDDIRPGIRSLTVRQHTVFYWSTKESIRVLRIVHARREPIVRLDDDSL